MCVHVVGVLLLLLLFFDPGTQFPGNEKITLCNTKKYKNQAGMNLTPPPPPPYYYYYIGAQCLVEMPF